MQAFERDKSNRLCLLLGEVHLEMCIKDLRERFAKIELQVSPPLVAFRESCFYPAEEPETIPKLAKVHFCLFLLAHCQVALLCVHMMCILSLNEDCGNSLITNINMIILF